MTKRWLLALALALLPAMPALTQEGSSAPVQAAASALGAASLQTIQFSGRGSDFIFGQSYDGSSAWPRFTLPSYVITIDYANNALRDDRRRAQVENPPLGGGFQPILGELRQIWMLSNGVAWDMVGETAVPAAVERDLRTAVEGRMAQIWMTPHGFIKAAQAGQATTRVEDIRGKKKTIITVTTPTKVKLEGMLNENNLVEHIETWMSHPMIGDMVYEADFSGYRDFGGVRFPTRIVHRSAGYPVLDVTITDVKPNVPVKFDVPPAIRQASAPAAGPLVPEKVSDGVWIMPGGAKSVVVEFRDHVIVVDAPEHEARSIAVMEATKKVVPGKPIRYVINTHSHFDHASGLRTYAAEGVTIVTHPVNIPYFEQLWAGPRTINPDRLARSGRKATFEGVAGSRTFTDGSRRLVVHHYAGNFHNPGMLMVHLPKERILIEADSYTPPATNNEAPGGVVNLVHFYQAVERLRLEVEQIIPIHGRLVTMDDLRAAVTSFGNTQIWER
jgi:glyoxylase-like metal-dependent hydrolase (beta-lactamase superfamily II)